MRNFLARPERSKYLYLYPFRTAASCLMILSALPSNPAAANSNSTPACTDASAPGQVSLPSGKIGSACTKDPSCVIVGQTHMLVWNSPNPAKIIVVCIHGLGLCARAYKPLADQLSVAGIDGYGVNVRGFGPDREQSERAKLNCITTVDDVCTLLQQVHKNYPDHKVILLGESMGGALAIRIAAGLRRHVQPMIVKRHQPFHATKRRA